MTSFPRRCAAALTHPLTVAALFTLLFNDFVLKSLWPGWVTGKLSDLAWVVFAPPLIAFALCRLTRGNLLAERGVFAVAYVGLPLLYAAFNTFEPLHEWIISGLLFLSGGAVGSPWDPTDSVVIPLGFALTLWIWRQSGARPADLRTRLSLYVAVIAALASLASTGRGPTPTEWHAGVTDDGSVIVEVPNWEYYRSNDGGLTWAEVTAPFDQRAISWGGESVETSRGTYMVRAFGVTLAGQGAPPKTVYSTTYLQEDSNTWAQRYSTRDYRNDIIVPGFDAAEDLLATEPVNIVYHEGSANVIVTLGLQGVVVGGPDGTWKQVAVGKFPPTGFSFLAKVGLLLSGLFWPAALALCVPFLAAALVLAEVSARSRDRSVFSFLRRPRATRLGVVGFLALVLIFVTWIASDSMWVQLGLPVLLIVAFPILLIASAWGWGTPREDPHRKLMAILYAASGAAATSLGFPPYAKDGWNNALTLLFNTDASFSDGLVIAGGLAYSLLAVAMYPPRSHQLAVLAVALLVMLGGVTLPFVLWLAGSMSLALATMASILCLIGTTFLLRWQLLRQTEACDTHLATTPPPPAPPR